MAIALLVPAAEAAILTAGFAVIHAQRRHVDRMTLVLATVAFMLCLPLLVIFSSGVAPVQEFDAETLVSFERAPD